MNYPTRLVTSGKSEARADKEGGESPATVFQHIPQTITYQVYPEHAD